MCRPYRVAFPNMAIFVPLFFRLSCQWLLVWRNPWLNYLFLNSACINELISMWDCWGLLDNFFFSSLGLCCCRDVPNYRFRFFFFGRVVALQKKKPQKTNLMTIPISTTIHLPLQNPRRTEEDIPIAFQIRTLYSICHILWGSQSAVDQYLLFRIYVYHTRQWQGCDSPLLRALYQLWCC